MPRPPALPALVALALVALLAGRRGADADSAPATLLGSPAPSWEGVRWLSRAPAGSLQPASFRGRVLVVLWFRGDRQDGVAQAAEARRDLGRADDVAFVALQWLGWRDEPVASPSLGTALLERHGLGVPHGVLAGVPERAAEAPFHRYAAADLPWIVVADRAGVVRCEGGARDAARLRREIESLRAVPGSANPIVGRPFGTLEALRWLTPDGSPFALGGSRLTLFRWWTNGCAFCTDSVPALARLEQRYAARGLRLVAVYHPKGLRLADADAREYARRLGFAGVLAFDDRWGKYLELQRRGALRRATSISVLVDSEGIVRWVHPGPRLHPSADPRFAQAASDHAALESLLDRWLPPPPATAGGSR